MRVKGFKMADSHHRVAEDIISCGFINSILFELNVQAEKIATNIFDKYFNECMYKTVDD